MIDIKFLRENPDVVRASQKGRGEDVAIVDKVLASDDAKRLAITLNSYGHNRMSYLNL